MFRLYFFIAIVATIFFQNSSHGAFAQTKENCEQELRRATNFFQAAKHDSALYLIDLCLSKRQPGQLERAEAYKLMGKVQIAAANTPGAKAAFREMLSLQPFAELDPKQESPQAIKIFNEVKIEFLSANTTTKGSKNWPWIAVSGSVVATVAALLFFK